MVVAKKFVYVKKFDGIPKDENIELQEEELLALQDGEVLFEAEYLSVDPYMRLMVEVHNLPFGSTLIGEQEARVIESKNPDYKVGEHYLINKGWRTHSIVAPGKDGTVIKPVKDYGLPLSLSLGALGMPGATAYLGVTEYLKPKEGEVVFVNAAAGAVGNVVGQVAKILGCKVIGCAGSPEKIAWLKQLGFDVVFNYKTEDMSKVLTEAAPTGINCFFDNVGGASRNKILKDHMATFGRVVICGAISEYNKPEHVDIEVPFMTFLMKGLTVRALRVSDFSTEKWNEGFDRMGAWIKQGKLQNKEHSTEGFANMRKAFYELFTGDNIGKAIVKA